MVVEVVVEVVMEVVVKVVMEVVVEVVVGRLHIGSRLFLLTSTINSCDTVSLLTYWQPESPRQENPSVSLMFGESGVEGRGPKLLLLHLALSQQSFLLFKQLGDYT